MLLDLYVKAPATVGFKIAPIGTKSRTLRSKVVFARMISVGILLTVTVTVVEFLAYILSSPTVTVMIAVPSPTAVTRPFSSTVATELLLDV